MKCTSLTLSSDSPDIFNPLASPYSQLKITWLTQIKKFLFLLCIQWKFTCTREKNTLTYLFTSLVKKLIIIFILPWFSTETAVFIKSHVQSDQVLRNYFLNCLLILSFLNLAPYLCNMGPESSTEIVHSFCFRPMFAYSFHCVRSRFHALDFFTKL